MKQVKFLFVSVFMLSIIFSGCKKDEDQCDGITCQNGGNCVNGQCNCPQGWTGEFCQTPIGTNPCVGITCQNGGTCVNGQCNCPSGWSGQFCEINTANPCLGVACYNGGTCVNGQCNCTQGYTGSDCSLQATPSSIRITKIEVTSFPAKDNGSDWDDFFEGQSEPDIYPELKVGNTTLWDGSPDYIPNAGQFTQVFIPNPSISINATTEYIIRLWDDDSLTPDDFMDGILFEPYSSTGGFPSVGILDAGGLVTFKLHFTYIF